MNTDNNPAAGGWTPAECPRASEHLTPGQARYAEATGRGGECPLCGAGPLRVVRGGDEPEDEGGGDEPEDYEAPSLDSLNADNEPPEVTHREDCRACVFGESFGHTCDRTDD